VKKFNTHWIYTFAIRIHPLTELAHAEGMLMKSIFFALLRAQILLQQGVAPQGFFSPSLKRSAGALLRSFYDLGYKPDDAFETDLEAPIQAYQIRVLVERAKEFETVLANELPGLATYIVYQKGIYSTDELISEADHHVPESLREILSPKAKEDIRQGGRCLAFEVGTASAFHMWRAVEAVMDSYHEALTGKTFAQAGVTRNWGEYIKTLVKAKAEKKITSFLDHIREEYRNPVSHPEETVELDEAFLLFGASMSAIVQMLRPVSEIRDKKAAEESAKAAAEPTLTAMAALAGALSTSTAAPLPVTPTKTEEPA
jgi:hypothetical protein